MSREKQMIEELADFLWRNTIIHTEDLCHDVAETTITAGYRKQSEGEWIRAENPPEEYRDECGELIPFLVCCQGTVYPFRAMYDGANWGDGIGVLKVTHWMPLPEPPKGD